MLAIRRAATALLLIVATIPAPANAGGGRDSLKVATWNLEWLVSPAAFNALKESCVPRDSPGKGAVRSLPCDVVGRLERSSRDFRALARYASELDADVVALQEVDGPAAARLVFPKYVFCFTSRAHVQNNGFAIRAGLPHRCGPDLHSLSLGDRLRRGAEIVLFPGEPRELHLLSIHLKSGCSKDPLDSPGKACMELARQVPALESWIDARAAKGQRFAVLGDFNRTLLKDNGAARTAQGRPLHLWPELDDGDPAESDLVNTATNSPFRNCSAGQGFRDYIDFIVLSRSVGAAMLPGSFERVTYLPRDFRRTKLSDHCPVSVRIRMP